MRRPAVSFVLALLLAAPAAASGAAVPGGAAVPERPTIDAARCETGEEWACRAGSGLIVSGTGLDGVATAVFLGGRGARDDRRARPVMAAPGMLTLVVPARVRQGPLKLITPRIGSAVSRKAVKLLSGAPAPPTSGVGERLAPGAPLLAGSGALVAHPYLTAAAAVIEVRALATGRVARTWSVPPGAGEVTWDGLVDGQSAPAGRYGFFALGAPVGSPFLLRDALFPIRGKHDLGQTATNDFGGARNHGGQDMFARCGTSLAAARAGRVQAASFQARAGNYVVLQDAAGNSYVYMHMREPTPLAVGDEVRAGQPVGRVGQTGRASGCHLHFELWTSPGWYKGGKQVDPLPELRRWEAFG